MSPKKYDKYIDNIEKISPDDLKQVIRNLCEERNYLFFLLENLHEGVVVIDEHLHAIYCNESAKQILSKSFESSATPTLRTLIDDPELYEVIRGTIEAEQRKTHIEQAMLVPHERLLNVSVLPLWHSDKTKRETLIILSDVTDKRKLQQEQTHAKKIEALVKLAAGVAHEIGNPLNSINIHLDILKHELHALGLDKKSAAHQTVAILAEETKRLDDIVKNFLMATRAKQQQLQIVDLNEVIRHVCGFLQPEIEEKQANLVVQLDENMPKALFDEGRIRQLLINVIKNAIDAINAGGDIEVITRAQGKLICLSIKDNGCGIAEYDIERIFDAYYTTKDQGSGLGLMIVYDIVIQHGGRIEVRSNEGEGTEFTIVFPLRRNKLKLPKGVSLKS